MLSRIPNSKSPSYTTGFDVTSSIFGVSLSDDEIGKPTNYYNGASYTMSWVQGRRLSSITTGGTTTTYAYDMDGIRRSKASGGVTTEFITQSGLVVRQTNGTVTLDFVYDSQQRPYALIYKNGTAAAVKYYYLLNLQGDVVGLLSSSGAVVARYSYNAWGKLLSVTDDSGATITSSSHIANRNPLRYRGYYYDSESGFYYLQSRYYDPSIGRFINADAQYDTDLNGGLNMFAYCENNPVNRVDPTGHSWKSFWSKVGNAIETAASAVVKAVKTVTKKTANAVNKIKARVAKPISRIWKSMEIDVGIGGGVRGNVNIGDFGLDIGFSSNVAQVHIDDGNILVVQSTVVAAELDMHVYTLGYKNTQLQDLNWNPLPASSETLGISSGRINILSAATYIGYGGSIDIVFNWEEFLDYCE